VLQAAAPSAALEAYIAAGGRQPGDAARDAVALANALAALPPAAAAATAAAQALARAHDALLAALRAAPPPPPDCTESSSDFDDAPQSAIAPLPPPDAGALAGIATAALQSRHRGRSWGDWLALTCHAAHGLERSADLCAAIAAAVADAPLQLPGATQPRAQTATSAFLEGGEAPLSAESADAMAQLWQLAPFSDDDAIAALIAAASRG
jgi:hypothetical protein